MDVQLETDGTEYFQGASTMYLQLGFTTVDDVAAALPFLVHCTAGACLLLYAAFFQHQFTLCYLFILFTQYLVCLVGLYSKGDAQRIIKRICNHNISCGKTSK